MTIDRIKFSQEFTYHGLSRWIGFEGTVTEGEDTIAAGLKMEQIATETIKAIVKKQSSEETEKVIQNEPKLTGFAHWENEINKCTTIEKPDGIESFRAIADMNPKLKEVFDNKLEQLKNNKL